MSLQELKKFERYLRSFGLPALSDLVGKQFVFIYEGEQLQSSEFSYMASYGSKKIAVIGTINSAHLTFNYSADKVCPRADLELSVEVPPLWGGKRGKCETVNLMATVSDDPRNEGEEVVWTLNYFYADSKFPDEDCACVIVGSFTLMENYLAISLEDRSA